MVLTLEQQPPKISSQDVSRPIRAHLGNAYEVGNYKDRCHMANTRSRTAGDCANTRPGLN